MKNYVRILVAVSVFLLVFASISIPVKAATTYGPRIDELLIKIYGTDVAEYAAFEASEIDLLDWPAGSGEVDRWSVPPYSNYIELDSFRELGMYEFDINNNLTMLSYPNWPSPTSYLDFRHAIAHMVDKDFIISTYLSGYGAKLESPIMPWLRWYDSAMPTHLYDPAEACRILHDAGWRDSADPKVVEDVHFPLSHPLAGQNLKDVMTNGPHGASDPGIIFYRRADDAKRSQAANLLIAGDTTHLGLQNIGIPVDDNNVPRIICSPVVMYRKNFHIYTGGWSLSKDPDYLYDVWSSRSPYYNPDPNSFAWNYININDPDWDTAISNVKFAENLDTAEYWSHRACQIFGNKVFFVPLYANKGYMAHKKPWHALNVESYGVRDCWNLESMHNPDIGSTGGQLRWGFASDVESLNVVFSQWQWDWQILDKIFQSLVMVNPLNIGVDMPWMASGWTFGTWTNPDHGLTASKITFTLRSDIKWINPITGTVYGPVTPEDVKFSFQYVFDHIGWNYASAADLYLNPDGTQKIEISGNEITFYESVKSAWALHWIGGLPIVPKSVFEPIADPHGFYPGSVYPQTLMGSGNFYFSSYMSGASCSLMANRNFFKSIVPDVDTDPTHIKIVWGIFKSNVKDGDWSVNVLDLIKPASELGWAGPPGDIPSDINKDGKVNVLDLIIVATNIGASW
jgi:ABC-type transport system substrate-binding protein